VIDAKNCGTIKEEDMETFFIQFVVFLNFLHRNILLHIRTILQKLPGDAEQHLYDFSLDEVEDEIKKIDNTNMDEMIMDVVRHQMSFSKFMFKKKEKATMTFPDFLSTEQSDLPPLLHMFRGLVGGCLTQRGADPVFQVGSRFSLKFDRD
jgi:hypothetical protein